MGDNANTPVNPNCPQSCIDSTCDSLLSSHESYHIYNLCNKCPNSAKCNIQTMKTFNKVCDETACKQECNSLGNPFNTVQDVVLNCNKCENNDTYKCNPESSSYTTIINNYYENRENRNLTTCINNCNNDDKNNIEKIQKIQNTE